MISTLIWFGEPHMHICTMEWGCVCYGRHFPMLCVSSLLRLQYMLCSFFCLSVHFVHSRRFIEDIIPRPVCQSAEKAVFFFFFSNMCRSKTGCLSTIWKSTDMLLFLLSDPFLPHPQQQCVFVCWEVVNSGFCVRLQNSIPAPLIGRATCLRDLCPFCWCCVNACRV